MQMGVRRRNAPSEREPPALVLFGALSACSTASRDWGRAPSFLLLSASGGSPVAFCFGGAPALRARRTLLLQRVFPEWVGF